MQAWFWFHLPRAAIMVVLQREAPRAFPLIPPSLWSPKISFFWLCPSFCMHISFCVLEQDTRQLTALSAALSWQNTICFVQCLHLVISTDHYESCCLLSALCFGLQTSQHFLEALEQERAESSHLSTPHEGDTQQGVNPLLDTGHRDTHIAINTSRYGKRSKGRKASIPITSGLLAFPEDRESRAGLGRLERPLWSKPCCTLAACKHS